MSAVNSLPHIMAHVFMSREADTGLPQFLQTIHASLEIFFPCTVVLTAGESPNTYLIFGNGCHRLRMNPPTNGPMAANVSG
ncbi:MAG: hypothetical protein HKN87_18360 [Saprospiraceae bacterium]|nr:hypothetical protein [Saprospiraceae bacterium]